MNATVHSISEQQHKDNVSTVERRMRAFVEGHLQKLPSPDAFTLHHEGGTGSALHSHKVDPKKTKGQTQAEVADAVVKDVLQVAQDHFESFGGLGQRYRLLAEAKGEALKAYFFGLGMQRPVVKDEPEVELSEIPKTLVNQLMKQNKELGIVMFEQMPSMLATTIEQFKLMAKDNARLMETQLQARQSLEDSLDRAAERRVMVQREENALRNRDELLQKLFREILPEIKGVLKRKMLGAASSTPQKPADASEDLRQRAEAQAVCREVFKIVGPEKITAALPEEHRGLVNDLVGIGSDPASIAEFREKLLRLWEHLSQEANDEMQEKIISAGKPELMQRLVDIAQGK